MSKGRGGANVNLSVKTRQQRGAVILEASPSAEIAFYDYEAALSQPEIEKLQINENEVKKNTAKDGPGEGKKSTSTDPMKGSNVKTVSFSTNTEVDQKSTPVAEIDESSSRQELNQEKCTTCNTIVNKSEDEGDNNNVKYIANGSKDSPKKPTTPTNRIKKYEQVSSARKEKINHNSPKVKTIPKNFAKKNIANLSLIDNNKNSKIPRATAVSCATAKILPIVPNTSKGNSKTSLYTRPFIATRSKSLKNNLRKEKDPIDEKEQKICEETTKTNVGNAGDHPSQSSKTSIVKNLRLNNACRSCNDQSETVNLELKIQDVKDPWSDSKSSPEIRSPNLWSKSMKISPYIESTSEDIDLSSEYSSDSMRPRKKKCFGNKTHPPKSSTFKADYTRNSPRRQRPPRRDRFSFLDTLFDIVFWPFLFLRTNR